jgi:hypothetical protein
MYTHTHLHICTLTYTYIYILIYGNLQEWLFVIPGQFQIFFPRFVLCGDVMPDVKEKCDMMVRSVSVSVSGVGCINVCVCINVYVSFSRSFARSLTHTLLSLRHDGPILAVACARSPEAYIVY